VTDNTAQFAKLSKGKADFIDFIASTFYAQNCAHCRSIQGLCIIAAMVGVVAASSGAVGSISALRGETSILLGYVGGFLSGAAISVLLWLGFFALWKAVTLKIVDMEKGKPELITEPVGPVDMSEYELPKEYVTSKENTDNNLSQ